MEQNLWVFKSVEDADRALQTVDNYKDKINSVYNYDSKVGNSMQIRAGDNILLVDKTKILGFAQIEKIEEKTGTKIIRKCPVCGSSTIDTRKNLKPKFRCNKGHEFSAPIEKVAEVKQYSAHYENMFLNLAGNKIIMNDLRPYYSNGYNQNMSMQLMDQAAIKFFPQVTAFLKSRAGILLPFEGADGSQSSDYEKKDQDERSTVFRQIKERRGQQKFRSDLLNRYGAVCMITDCEIMDILEAAHINPYRGINDNHASNGLILRSDIHTLFDLNLVGIDPDTLTVHFHKKAAGEYKEFDKKKLGGLKTHSLSKSALVTRWKIFKGNE